MQRTRGFAFCVNLGEETKGSIWRNTGNKASTHTCPLYFSQQRLSEADDIVVGGFLFVEKDADLVPAACQSEKHARGTY